MIIGNGKKLVMIGDSITDCERARPVGEGLFEAMGRGYVTLVDALIKANDPASRIRVVNMGISGNTVRDLKQRWDTDVLALSPNWVSIFIGANDVWRQYDSPLETEIHVSLEEYRRTYEELILRTKPSTEGIVLMAPYYMETQKLEPMRHTMDAYAQVVRELAEAHGCVFVDLPAAFDAYLAHYGSQALAWDRIHPSTAGHMIIAKAFLDAVGFAWA